MPLKRILDQLVFAVGLGVTVWLVSRLGIGPIVHALAAIGVGGILLLALARDVPGASLWTFVWGRMMRDAGGELLPGWAR